MTQFNYKSEYSGDLRLHDTNTSQHLSDYVYEKLWYETIQMKGRYQYMISNNSESNIVWTIGKKYLN